MRDYTIKYNLKCKFCGMLKTTTKGAMTNHEKHCKENPNAIPWKGHKVSKATRQKISNSMKTAIKEGRATGWHKRKTGTKSYPEKWMTSVIENNFSDKEFIEELHVGKYRLDFAWPKKMLYIEIDGQQHDYRKDKDLKKDEFCKSLGWKVLRMSWSYIASNKEEAIRQMKNFIDNGIYSEIEWKSKSSQRKEFETAHETSGCLKNINGYWCPQKFPDSVWENRKQSILNCGVDLTCFGWLNKVCAITGLTKKQVTLTIKRFNIVVYKTKRAGVAQLARAQVLQT